MHTKKQISQSLWIHATKNRCIAWGKIMKNTTPKPSPALSSWGGPPLYETTFDHFLEASTLFGGHQPPPKPRRIHSRHPRFAGWICIAPPRASRLCLSCCCTQEDDSDPRLRIWCTPCSWTAASWRSVCRSLNAYLQESRGLRHWRYGRCSPG